MSSPPIPMASNRPESAKYVYGAWILNIQLSMDWFVCGCCGISHNRTNPSLRPLANSCPSGEKATEITSPELLHFAIGLPLSGFQSLTARSELPEARIVPSGE